MKRGMFFLILVFLVVRSSCAQTDPQTAQFLRKLNLYYNCPSREGVKGFSCVLTLGVSELFKNGLEKTGSSKHLVDSLDGQKFTLEITADGIKSFSAVEPILSGDSTFDTLLTLQLKFIRFNFYSVIETWTEDVFKPGFGEDTFSETVCTVSKQQQGFIVDQKANDGSDIRLTYDSKCKLTEAKIIPKNGITSMDILLNYSNGPKGYQLDSYQGTSSIMSATGAAQFTYEPVGKYILLKRIIKEIQAGNVYEKGSALTMDFSNYRLIQ